MRRSCFTVAVMFVTVLAHCATVGADELARWRLGEKSGQAVREAQNRVPSAFLGEEKQADSSDPVFVDGALDFDGENDMVDLGNHRRINAYKDMTVMTWLRPARPKRSMMAICQNVRF